MTNRVITDAAVSRLHLPTGRADLLEGILAMSETDTLAEPARPSRGRHQRWLLPVLVAAAVAVLLGVLGTATLWPAGDSRHAAETPPAAPGQGDIAVLTTPGWTVTYTYVDVDGGEIRYENGKESIDVDWRPARFYTDYLQDRQLIRSPKVDPGVPLEVLGRPALLWPYSKNDHTVIREVSGDFSLEVRGQGMDETAFRGLLGDLRAIDPADLDDYLPDDFVTSGERADAVAQMLADVPLPDGFDPAAITSQQTDPYQLGAEVTGAVACEWLDQFATATEADDSAAAEQAAAALATSRDWSVLQQMVPDGEYPEVIWGYADQVAAGEVPEGYRKGLSGCAAEPSANASGSARQ